ncbi:MAG: ABC transporter ATPase [Flavobacteriaceae bacterium]|nr:ABC transporter ATPase [Flavobacteriaceae bacterium]
MFVDFKLLPDSSRVWIYQADREFTEHEIEQISKKLYAFISNWKRHGEDLKASFQLKYDQFIILAVDENYNDVSGCSIDASVHIIKELEREFNVDLLNKMRVSFKDGTNINIVSLKDFAEYAKLQKINADTVVFNNMVNSKADFESAWEVEASKSWHAKFLA